MIRDHALCRHCGHVVRTDWEICFHCGVRRPVARSLGSVGFRVGSGVLLFCLMIAAAANVAAVWNIIRGTPAQIAQRVATAAPAVAAEAGKIVPAIPLPDVDGTIPETANRVASAGTQVIRERSARGQLALRRPTLPQGPALSIEGALADSAACGEQADSVAALPLDAPIVRRAIAACPSSAALDGFEDRLRASHPDDPSLEPGGRVARRIQARREALAPR